MGHIDVGRTDVAAESEGGEEVVVGRALDEAAVDDGQDGEHDDRLGRPARRIEVPAKQKGQSRGKGIPSAARPGSFDLACSLIYPRYLRKKLSKYLQCLGKE